MSHDDHRSAQRPAPWTSARWIQYFQHNAEHLLPIPWDIGVTFTPEEKEAITSSLQEFQLGETSEGKHFIHRATQYSRRTGDRDYVHILKCFIAEEHRHARDLGRVLDISGLGRTNHSWPDSVFRWLRHRAGMEFSMVVLVSAEIIAKIYYAALKAATRSAILQRICDQILVDEVEHIRFQCERVAILRSRLPRWRIALRRLGHQFLFFGTCLVVWHKHCKAFRKGGYPFALFWQASWQEMHNATELMDPRNYAMQAEPSDVRLPIMSAIQINGSGPITKL